MWICQGCGHQIVDEDDSFCGRCGRARHETSTAQRYDVILMQVPRKQRVRVIKLVRQFTGCGLKEGLEQVENLPAIVAADVTCEQAREAAAALTALGAATETVEARSNPTARPAPPSVPAYTHNRLDLVLAILAAVPILIKAIIGLCGK